MASTSPRLRRSPRGDFECGRRLDLLVRVAPQDGRAAFGRNDAVDGELLHQHAVADGDAERSPAASLAAHQDDDRHFEHHHLAQVEAIASATPRSSDSTPG